MRSPPPRPELQPLPSDGAEALRRAPPDLGPLIHVPSGHLSCQPHAQAFILVFTLLHGKTSFAPTIQMLADLVRSYPYCHGPPSIATVLLYF